MKRRILLIGENRERCRKIMEALSTRYDVVYSKSATAKGLAAYADSGYSIAAVYDPAQGETELMGAVSEFSEKNGCPVFIIGTKRDISNAGRKYPNAFFCTFGGDELPETIYDADERKTAVFFSRKMEYFGFLEQKFEDLGSDRLIPVYCNPDRRSFSELKNNGIKPDVFIFCEDVIEEGANPDSFFEWFGFAGLPSAILMFIQSSGDVMPDTVIEYNNLKFDLIEFLKLTPKKTARL